MSVPGNDEAGSGPTGPHAAHHEAADNLATLIRMANQIAQFFASNAHAEGAEGVAAHINQFWDPRMRRRFLAAAEARGGELHALVAEALPQVKR